MCELISSTKIYYSNTIMVINLNDNPFFIIGCQRSGTTLLRLILESHSKVRCFDEPDSYSLLQNFKKSNSKQEEFICYKTPLITEQFHEPFFSDPSFDFLIPNIFENCKRIFILRDVRDTICSMIKLPQGSSTWFEYWPKKTIEFWKFTISNFTNQFSDDLKLISKSSENLYAYASFYWKIKTQSFLEYNSDNTLGIRYEDLVKNPKTTIQEIIKFLELSWEDSLMQHPKKAHSMTDSKGITVGNTNTKLSIFDSSVGQFKQNMSSEQEEIVLSISGPLMKKLGYVV